MKKINYRSGYRLRTFHFDRRFSKQWKRLLMLGVFLWIGMVGITSPTAATLCVDAITGTSDGSSGCYDLPSLAVAAAAANVETDVILIHPGTYAESGTITINETNLKILGTNPVNTILTNATGTVFKFVSTASGEIAGLTITGGGNGIEVANGPVTIRHNHIEFNSGNGINASTNSSVFRAFNNIIRGNSANGIYGPFYELNSIAYNNIVVENDNDGINGVIASFNSSYLNGTMDYRGIAGGEGNISQDCLFANKSSKDYRLQTNSPCKNKGNPTYFDVDGTPSDMGSFGGPGAALFWPYGNGGPVVTNLTVDPPFVPEGGSISIKATVEIR